MLVARSEGFISAPETNHALACVVDVAKQCKEEGKEKVILFNFSGHGLIDLGAYEQFLSGNLTDYEYPAKEIEEADRLGAQTTIVYRRSLNEMPAVPEEIEEAEKILEQYPKPEILKSH